MRITHRYILSIEAQHEKCPNCDEELPENPSDELYALFLTAREFKALGDHLSFKELNKMALNNAQLCRQHKYETAILPLAKISGWPTQINFPALIHEVYKCHLTFSFFLSDVTLFSSYPLVSEEVLGRTPGMTRLQIEERIMTDYPPLMG